jgi:hypothetical protein
LADLESMLLLCARKSWSFRRGKRENFGHMLRNRGLEDLRRRTEELKRKSKRIRRR